jgi:type IV pilus assembly protein PilB
MGAAVGSHRGINAGKQEQGPGAGTLALRRAKTSGPGLVKVRQTDDPLPDDQDASLPDEEPGEGEAVESGIAAEVDEGINRDRKLLGEILLEAELVTQEQLDAALEAQKSSGARLGAELIDAGVVDAAQITRALGEQYSMPVVDVSTLPVEPRAVATVPEDLARSLQVVPLSKAGNTFNVVIADPTDPTVKSRLEKLSGMRVAFSLAPPDDIQAAIQQAYGASTTVSDAINVFEARVSARQTTTQAAQEVDANAPVVQVVSTILNQAVRDGASDVHIEPMGDRVRVRNRVDGALHEVISLPQSMAQALVSRIKIMADMNIVERRRPQDGQIETEIDGRALDVRVSTTSTVNGEKTVLRILDKARALYDVSTLGMPADTAAEYQDIIKSPYGMVVCAGPTGSGKTTTLYASLMAINSDEINVMTVEDPVEYTFPTINQIGIQEQAGVTFAAGLRAILRQDPDAILVGEIRDVETARIAIQAALTGHFVLSTIHATDATSALHRFLDMGIESFLLASSMLAVVGQRLIRRNCQSCTGPYEPSIEDLAFYERAGGKPLETFVKGHGCAVCSGTGFHGRIGVYEVLRVTNEMRDLIVRNATLDEIRKLAVEQGMVPMRDQALRLVADEVTTIAEVMRTIYIL